MLAPVSDANLPAFVRSSSVTTCLMVPNVFLILMFYASSFFFALAVCVESGGAWLMNPTSPDNPVTTFRFMIYWCIALKTLAVTTAAQNAAFWGPSKQTAECCPTTGAPLPAPAAAAGLGGGLGGGLSVKVGA